MSGRLNIRTVNECIYEEFSILNLKVEVSKDGLIL